MYKHKKEYFKYNPIFVFFFHNFKNVQSFRIVTRKKLHLKVGCRVSLKYWFKDYLPPPPCYDRFCSPL